MLRSWIKLRSSRVKPRIRGQSKETTRLEKSWLLREQCSLNEKLAMIWVNYGKLPWEHVLISDLLFFFFWPFYWKEVQSNQRKVNRLKGEWDSFLIIFLFFNYYKKEKKRVVRKCIFWVKAKVGEGFIGCWFLLEAPSDYLMFPIRFRFKLN